MPLSTSLSRARVLAAATAAAAVLAGVALASVPAQAAPTPSSSCDYANSGTGTYSDTICWLDLSTYDGDLATGADGQAVSFSIPGGYTLSATLTSSADNVYSTALPTFDHAYLGQNGHYSGISGKPALYQSEDGGSTTLTLSGITAVDSSGAPVTGFSLVGADAESTDGGEHLTWTASSPLTSLAALGNACPSGFTGIGTASVTCTGGATTQKTGTPIVAAAAPTTFSQEMTGRGLEGVAFGILVTKVQLSKQVVRGFNGDRFRVDVATAGGTSVGSATTSAAGTATTGAITLLSNTADSPYTLSETAVSGDAAKYTPTWACTQNTTPSTALPVGAAGTSATVALRAGDSVKCTITNTGKHSSLGIVKHAAAPVDVDGNGIVDAGDTIRYTYTVTNTGTVAVSNVHVVDAQVGAVTCASATLAAGASTTCTAVEPYVITVADARVGVVGGPARALGVPAGATAEIASALAATSTPTAALASAPSATAAAAPAALAFTGSDSRGPLVVAAILLLLGGLLVVLRRRRLL